MFKFLIIFNTIILITSLPVAILHGFYDSCSNPYFASLINLITYNLGDYSICIKTGEGSESLTHSFKEQAEKACEEIKSNPKFSGDFSILSISQGGLLARYIIQKCEMPGKVKKLVSFGGPMMGTSKAPFCLDGVVCYIINTLADFFAYTKISQNNIGPAGYYRSSAHLDEYKDSESFLVQLNNEGKDFDENSKKKFSELESLMLIGFTKDKMISPKETAEFCEFDKNYKVIPMNMTDVYMKDLFGLQTLDKKKAIHVHYLEGDHINFDFNDVLRYAIPYL